MKRYKEWLEESLDIKESLFGTNAPNYDNKEIDQSFGFIYRTYINFNDTIFSVEFYGENIPKEMITADKNILNYKNSVHFSVVKDNKVISDRNLSFAINSLYGKLIFIFKELMKKAKYNGGFSIISPLKDERRDKFYTNRFSTPLLSKILNYFNLSNYTVDEIDLIMNQGKAKRYKFVREN